MKENKSIKILNLDAKDIYIANHYNKENPIGYNIRRKDGTISLRKFSGDLDYCLDLFKLRDIYKEVYRNKRFSFFNNGKEYTQRVINVTFNYSNKEYNRVTADTYVKFGYDINDIQLEDHICFVDNELVAIQVGKTVKNPVEEERLEKYFYLADGKYQAKDNIGVLNSVADLRRELYENGFYCDGIKYIRFKRSSGSSRVGKCLFIDEKLYSRIHKWECCGLKIKDDSDIDLAAFEAYISLTLSSIIDTVEIKPENILVIDDYHSVFKDTAAAVTYDNGNLHTSNEEVEIDNSIWDGQTLMDYSLFGNYRRYGMLLLRNRFFKTAAFSTHIQEFFNDYGITEVSQLNGFTLAKDIKDIKLITTPSSVKYLKFGTIEQWLENLEPTFGIVKHEKPTHYFDGRLVQTHYQLLNTLQLSYEEVERLLAESFEYMLNLRYNPAVVRHHIKYPENPKVDLDHIATKNDVVYQLLGLNDKFVDTRIYHDFLKELLTSFKKNLMSGHVLVNGNYSTLFGNPFEMLLQSIGKFDGTSELGVGNIHNIRFEYDTTILGSRSPHICAGNILLSKNVANENIDKYFHLTEEIVCVNSINENLLQRLNGCDYDSDTLLLSNNQLLIQAAMRNYDKFLVPTSLIEAVKTKRLYNNIDKSDLDIRTSVNKIGEIVNLSQELNTLFWDNLYNGKSFEDNEDIYKDIAKLSILSGIEIDKAKKEFQLDSAQEIAKLKQKYLRLDNKKRYIKPNFFGHLARTKGFYNSKRKNYKQHHTTMDYLQTIIRKFRIPRYRWDGNKNQIPFIEIVDKTKYTKGGQKRNQITKILSLVREMNADIKLVYSAANTTSEEKYRAMNDIRDRCINTINDMKISASTMYFLLKELEKDENKDISMSLFHILFSSKNGAFFDLVLSSKQPVGNLKKDENGIIHLYGVSYIEVRK